MLDEYHWHYPISDYYDYSIRQKKKMSSQTQVDINGTTIYRLMAWQKHWLLLALQNAYVLLWLLN